MSTSSSSQLGDTLNSFEIAATADRRGSRAKSRGDELSHLAIAAWLVGSPNLVNSLAIARRLMPRASRKFFSFPLKVLLIVHQ